jgi:hypothetical protein
MARGVGGRVETHPRGGARATARRSSSSSSYGGGGSSFCCGGRSVGVRRATALGRRRTLATPQGERRVCQRQEQSTRGMRKYNAAKGGSAPAALRAWGLRGCGMRVGAAGAARWWRRRRLRVAWSRGSTRPARRAPPCPCCPAPSAVRIRPESRSPPSELRSQRSCGLPRQVRPAQGGRSPARRDAPRPVHRAPGEPTLNHRSSLK